MNKFSLLSIICASLVTMSAAMAQSTSFTSVPAVAFVDAKFAASTEFNRSGTAHHFNVQMFAPVNLPHGNKVTLV